MKGKESLTRETALAQSLRVAISSAFCFCYSHVRRTFIRPEPDTSLLLHTVLSRVHGAELIETTDAVSLSSHEQWTGPDVASRTAVSLSGLGIAMKRISTSCGFQYTIHV